MTEKPFAPIVFFTEGSVTNGSVLSKPRRGAFIPLKPMTPMFLEYEYHTVSPSYDCILGFELFILACSSSFFANQVARKHIFPDFHPNEYMWKTHKDKGFEEGAVKEKWDIYAWAWHDFMSNYFDLPQNPQHNREKVKLQKFMYKRTD